MKGDIPKNSLEDYLVPINKFKCPLCGSDIKWSCSTNELSIGHVDCQNGTLVSHLMSVNTPEELCSWWGTWCVRLDGEVYAAVTSNSSSSF